MLEELRAEFADDAPRSLVLVGESGVGKTAIRQAFLGEATAAGWSVIETSAAALIAGQSYIGEIEKQINRLLANARTSKRVVVSVSGLAELSQFGRYKGKDSSVLDQLWPSIVDRSVFIVAESSVAGLQSVAQRIPTLTSVLRIVRVPPATESEAGAIARELLLSSTTLTDETAVNVLVGDAMQLAQQYLGHKALPGSVLALVELAANQADSDDEALSRRHLLKTLSRLSGLPSELLDEEQVLDIEALQRRFSQSVLGQDEAVEALVDRVALLKAGLTDPSRPVGVFLFAGPTGTGKTEIAKTLAKELFGSKERMIRIDMSEFQHASSVDKLLGGTETTAGEDASLTARVRRNPFAVVLLDEFEKAHPNIWDLFLQVFDDGRLTDARGLTADFRHTFILLTSNLGAKIDPGQGLGFGQKSQAYSARDVTKRIADVFRPEFLNRLDKVVVFNPLGRAIMKGILQKELTRALDRRGLRQKDWAIEWEDSAIEFLLDAGFTPDLGARPLRRAIEQHFLVPLSKTIVQNQAPTGEQFLYIKSDGLRLQAEFIDPDADAKVSDPPLDVEAGLALGRIVRAPTGSIEESRFVLSRLDAMLADIDDTAWRERKNTCLNLMNSDGFWDRSDRSDVLEQLEKIDRVDTAAATLRSLSARLRAHPANATVIRNVANRIYVLQEGILDVIEQRCDQALLGIDAHQSNAESAADFIDLLKSMYSNWARERGMRTAAVVAPDSSQQRLGVAGFGAFAILAAEQDCTCSRRPDATAGRVARGSMCVSSPGRASTWRGHRPNANWPSFASHRLAKRRRSCVAIRNCPNRWSGIRFEVIEPVA